MKTRKSNAVDEKITIRCSHSDTIGAWSADRYHFEFISGIGETSNPTAGVDAA